MYTIMPLLNIISVCLQQLLQPTNNWKIFYLFDFKLGILINTIISQTDPGSFLIYSVCLWINQSKTNFQTEACLACNWIVWRAH